jgi:hypothetical protein
MTDKIKVLKTNGVNGLVIHKIGEDGVTEIVDNSIDTEQNTVIQYWVYIDGKLKYTYSNGIYEIEFV